MKKDPVMTALAQASKGLLFPSETDAEIEPFTWKGDDELTAERFLAEAGYEADIAVEETSLQSFFRAVPSEERAKFDKLAETLRQNLSDVTVYKIGEVEKSVFIVGRTQAGTWAGLKTKVVET